MAHALPRAVAITVLVRVEEGGFANVILPEHLRGTDLEARERAAVTELVYGTVRRVRALDYLLARVTDRPLDDLDPPVRAALRLGAYQLVTGVPAHAAVGETVAAIARIAPHARGYVNAVLRRTAELGPSWPWPEGNEPAALAVRESMPDWIVATLVRDLGAEDARRVIEAANQPGVLTLRANPRRVTPDALAAELTDGGGRVERGVLVPGALLVQGIGDPARLAAVRDGRATPQDQSSQAVVALVGARPGDRVLEVGAAPGGKATALAEAMDDTGTVVALDLNPDRMRLITTAATRLGLNAVRPVVGDGRRLPVPDACFDRVLVDAPCSGLGVLRRRPDARWRGTEPRVTALAEIQRDLLTAAAVALRPGGRLVYSVCTLTNEETSAIDAWAEAALPGLEAEPPPGSPWTPVGRGARLLPHSASTDGMYALILTRRAD